MVFFPKSESFEYTFLYKSQLTIVIKKQANHSSITSISIYFTRETTLRINSGNNDNGQKQLGDTIVKFFNEQIKESQQECLVGALNTLCYVFNCFEEIIQQLNDLQEMNKISGLKFGKDSKFHFELKPRRISLLTITF